MCRKPWLKSLFSLTASMALYQLTACDLGGLGGGGYAGYGGDYGDYSGYYGGDYGGGYDVGGGGAESMDVSPFGYDYDMNDILAGTDPVGLGYEGDPDRDY